MKKNLDYVIAMVICGGLYAASYICRFAAVCVVYVGLLLEQVYDFGIAGRKWGEKLICRIRRWWNRTGRDLVNGEIKVCKEKFMELVKIREEILIECGRGDWVDELVDRNDWV